MHDVDLAAEDHEETGATGCRAFRRCNETAVRLCRTRWPKWSHAYYNLREFIGTLSLSLSLSANYILRAVMQILLLTPC